MGSVWIISGTRTPVGKFLGELSFASAPQLAGVSIAETISRASIDSLEIDEVIIGQVLMAGVGQAPARQASIAGGVPTKVGCATVNKVCGSGLYSVFLASRAIRSGDAKIVLAGGMESMSQAPHVLRGGRSGWKYGSQPLLDVIEQDGLRCPRGSSLMGVYADRVAIEIGVSRADQDAWALRSHQRALAAQAEGAFQAEIVTVSSPNQGSITVDSGPRSDTSIERLARLKPAFGAEGTVTPGNASSLSDGAASVLVVNDEVHSTLKPSHAFRIVGIHTFAQAPGDLFTAPVGAIRNLLSHCKRAISDIDLFEINEAFASQTIACMRQLEIPEDRLNVHGGAIAIGHPIGCSGSRVLVTLMHAMKRHQKSLGIASLCLGGGEAVAMLIELV